MNKFMGIHVLHIIDQLRSTGGAENRLINDLKLLDKNKINNTVFCLFKPEEDLVNFLRNFNVQVYYCPKNSLFKLFYLIQLIKKIRPNIVHTQLFFSDIIGRIVAFLCGVPVIISTFQSSVHEPGVPYYYSKRRRFADFLTSKLCTHFIAVSEFVKQSISKRLFIDTKKISVIYNYVEKKKSRSRKKRSDSITFCCVGKLNPAKGQFELIKAFEKLVMEEKKVKLFLVGDGSEREEYEKYVIEKELSNYISFLGNTDKVRQILEDCDAFVFPTHSEGLSLALLEAVLTKKPCIISSILPNLEVINSKDCFLFEPKNSESILVALRTFFEVKKSRPEELKNMVDLAYKKASKKFNSRIMASKLQNLYFKLFKVNK